MKRIENWPRKLSEILQEKAAASFVWGENDCCLFVADCVKAITGVDYADEWRGLYQDEAGANTFVGFHGGLVGLLDYAIGKDCRVMPNCASRGDVVIAGGAAGVVDDTGRRVALYVDGRGLARSPISSVTHAWRIG